MTKILFVCHGNICRSPAAQFVFNKLIKQKNLDKKYSCYSLALTTEEIGNDIYPPMKVALDKRGIEYDKHQARLITNKDVDDVDYIVYMDDENKWLLDQSFPNCNKTICLAKFLSEKEISDPWYHRGFDGTLDQIYIACERFLDWLEKK